MATTLPEIHRSPQLSSADGLTAPYLSYWNGKSAGRLAEPGLRPCGVHFFAAARGDAAKNDAQDRGAGIVLLHFPFCHFRTWRHKFNVLDATQRSDWGHYRDARLAIVDAGALQLSSNKVSGRLPEDGPTSREGSER